MHSPALLLSLTTLFWAGNAIVGKLAVGQISPLELSFWRWVLAGVILAPFAWRAAIRDLPFYRQKFWPIFFLAFLSVSVYNTFQYLALQWTSAINIGVVSTTMPMMVFLLTWLMGQERADRYQLAGLAAAMVGVLVVITRGNPQVLLTLNLNPGDLLMLLAVLSFALYSVLLKHIPAEVNRIGLLFVLIVLGIIGILPFYLWDISSHPLFELNRSTGLILLYVAVFPSLASYFFWNRAVALGGANLAGLFINLIPVYASVLAFLVLDERVSLFQLMGMLAIGGGIYIATLYRSRVRARNQTQSG